MDQSASLSITQKGADEIKNRTHKLSMRKRSVLILLEKPRTVEQVLSKSVFHSDEIIDEIQTLVGEGFIALGGEAAQFALETAPVSSAGGNSFQLDDEIILSEAKFLLIDFCVDSFGTQSQAFTDQIRACKSAGNLSACLASIFATAEKQCPDRLPALRKLVKEINETA